MERFHFLLDANFKSVEMIRNRVKAALLKHFGSTALAGIDDFCQIVSELLNNGVEHGACSTIEGELVINIDNAEFTLITKGARFDPTAAAAGMPEFDQQDELPEGGYGLAIIKQLSDTFTYKYIDGKNMATVSKFINRNNI